MNIQTEEEQEYFEGLKKLIDYLIFGRLKPPKMRKDETFKMGNNMIDLLAFVTKDNKMVDVETAKNDFEIRCTEFVNKSHKFDRVDLMNCFGFSSIRTYINLIAMFQPELAAKPKFMKNNDMRDAFITTDLIFKKKIAAEIQIYLNTHFTDFLSFIPLGVDRIDNDQYLLIQKTFVRHLDYTEVLQKCLFGFDEEVES